MSTLQRLEVYSNWPWASGTRQAILPLADCLLLTTTERLTREDELALVVPSAAEAADELTKDRVLVLRNDDATFTAYRMVRVTDGSGRARDRVTVAGRGPLFDLRDYGFLTTTSGTTTTLGKTYTLANIGEIIDDLLASWLPSWWDKGDISASVAKIPVTATGNTPLEVLRAAITALAAIGYTVELDIRPNGTTGCYIDVVTSIGATATSPDLRTGKNLLELQRILDRDEQCSTVYPTCADGATIAANWWVITDLSGSDVTLAAPETGESPCMANDQFNGWYLRTDDNSPAYRQITDCTAAGVFTMASVTGLAVGELTRLVRDSAGAGALVLVNPAASASGARILSYPTGRQPTTNFAKNPIFDDFTAGQPDDWSQWRNNGAAPLPTLSQDSTNVQVGTYAVSIVSGVLGVGHAVGIRMNSGYNLSRLNGTTTHTFRLRVRVYSSGTADIYAGFTLTATGTDSLTTYDGVNNAYANSNTSGWRTIELTCPSVDTTTYLATGPYVFVGTATSSTTIVVDAVAFTIDEDLPSNYPRGSGVTSAWVAANEYLADRASAPPRYAMQVADLNAWDPTAWPYEAIALGATANVRDTDLDVTTAQRLVELTRDHKNLLATRVNLVRAQRSFVRTYAAT